MSLFDLKECLDADHVLAGEAAPVNYPASAAALQTTLRTTLAARYGLPADFRLSRMHEYFSDAQLDEHAGESGHWVDPLQSLGGPMVSEYHRFLGWLSVHLGFDFVFENDPLVRYHAPGRRLGDRYRLEGGEIFAHHSDTMLGDYFQQLNCWLPFCDVKGTGALSVCSKQFSITTLRSFVDQSGYSYGEYKESRSAFFEFMRDRPDLVADLREDAMPANLRYGQCLLFDPRVLHGTAENVGDSTRVSMDFRLVPLADFEAVDAELRLVGTDPNSYEGDRLVRGEFYHALTARQVAGA